MRRGTGMYVVVIDVKLKDSCFSFSIDNPKTLE